MYEKEYRESLMWRLGEEKKMEEMALIEGDLPTILRSQRRIEEIRRILDSFAEAEDP